MHQDGTQYYRCIKPLTKNAVIFCAGHQYLRRLPGAGSVSLDKTGGGVIALSDEELVQHFVPVFSVRCTYEYTIMREPVFRKGGMYWARSSDTTDDVHIYPGRQDAVVTLSAQTFKKHFTVSA